MKGDPRDEDFPRTPGMRIESRDMGRKLIAFVGASVLAGVVGWSANTIHDFKEDHPPTSSYDEIYKQDMKKLDDMGIPHSAEQMDGVTPPQTHEAAAPVDASVES